MVFFSLFLVLMIITSLSLGYINIPIADIIAILYGKITADLQILKNINATYLAVILDVRLPRILTCAGVGAALAVSGSLFQGILLNPLADPYTLGVSAGAAFGACVAIILNLSAAYVSVPLFAFIGACTTLFVVMFLSYSSKNPMAGLFQPRDVLTGMHLIGLTLKM